MKLGARQRLHSVVYLLQRFCNGFGEGAKQVDWQLQRTFGTLQQDATQVGQGRRIEPVSDVQLSWEPKG
jgi:hypothetical protein